MTTKHTSDCAIHNASALPTKTCNCQPEPKMTIQVVERKDTLGTWSVEAINYKADGEIYLAIFSGPLAKDRAVEYAQMKYGLEYTQE